MKTISEVKKEFNLYFSTKPNVLTDIGRDRVWTFIQSTLTEFIEALDLREMSTPESFYGDSTRDVLEQESKARVAVGVLNKYIREKRTIVDKFMKGQK